MAVLTTEQPVSARLTATLETLEWCISAAAAYGRPDLVERLREQEIRLHDPAVNTLVVGEFKKGKSTLVNGLLSAEICPTDGALATAVPTAISYGPETTVTAIYAANDETPDGDEQPRREPGDLADLEVLALESEQNSDGNLRGIEVTLPRRILRDGVVLVDTPGVGGLNSRHGGATATALNNADAVLFVTDAGQELTAAEAEFLDRAREACPTLALVLTKIDIYPHWRDILELDRAHLESLGVDAPLIPVSSAIRYEAIAEEDRDLSEESGFPELVGWLRQVSSDIEGTSVQGAVHRMADAVAQMSQTMAVEREVLSSPETTESLMEELGVAEERAKNLQQTGSQWQTTLNDGITDLTADVDHDLRDRIRKINTEAQVQIEKGDPLKIWGEFEPWLYEHATQTIVDNYQLLRDRTDALGQRIGDVFHLEEADVVTDISVEPPTEALEAVEGKAEFEPKKTKIVETTFTALKGGQSGLLLFGMLGGVIGIAVEGPILIVAGLFMAGKSIRDEKKRQVTARRQQAVTSIRKYLDEVSFLVGKESRDSLRAVQRALRDHYQRRAVELQTSTQHALQAVRSAVQTDEQGRRARHADLEAELGRLDALAKKIEAL